MQILQSRIHFNTASRMLYANRDKVVEKAEKLTKRLIKHLEDIDENKELKFRSNEMVVIPDIHGDFVHLMLTLRRHGLIDDDLNLKKKYKCVFLGDFYNRGKDSDVVDNWFNKQIELGREVYRLIGNHELLFLLRDENGNPLVKIRAHDKNGNITRVPANDIEKDTLNGYEITEEVLENIANGSFIAACSSYDKRYLIPILRTHSFVTKKDFDLLEVETPDVDSFAKKLNETLIELGKESYERFLDCKEKEKYNWEEIREPFTRKSFFNIFQKDSNGRFVSYINRVTGVIEVKNGENTTKKIATSFNDELPNGVYQIVGHTNIADFDLPRMDPIKPIIISDNKQTSHVQFADVGIGFYYKPRSFKRPEVIINGDFSEVVT